MVSIAGGEDDWYLRVSKKDPDITVSDSYKTGNDEATVITTGKW